MTVSPSSIIFTWGEGDTGFYFIFILFFWGGGGREGGREGGNPRASPLCIGQFKPVIVKLIAESQTQYYFLKDKLAVRITEIPL